MSELDQSAPISDDEILYRRIPVSQGWYDRELSEKPSPEAFRPRRDDTTGLSVVRGGAYNSAEQAARGPSKSGYYVVLLRAGDLKRHGIEVVPRPVEGVSGHAEITSLNAANRDTEEAKNLAVLLARQLSLRVEGPFFSAAG